MQQKNCLYVLFVPYRTCAFITCDLLKVPHLQVMEKEEMTSAKKIKSKYIQGFYKETLVFKPGHRELLKSETVKNGQSKMHYSEVLF